MIYRLEYLFWVAQYTLISHKMCVFPSRILFHAFLYIHGHIFALMFVCVYIQGINLFSAHFRSVYTFHNTNFHYIFSNHQNSIYFRLNALCYNISKAPTYITKRQRFNSYSLKENCNCFRNIRHA